jgi:hypothetical protein
MCDVYRKIAYWINEKCLFMCCQMVAFTQDEYVYDAKGNFKVFQKVLSKGLSPTCFDSYARTYHRSIVLSFHAQLLPQSCFMKLYISLM